MRQVKKYLLTSMLLCIYIAAIALLIKSFSMYQQGYQNLSRLMAHSSIEAYEEGKQGE